MCFMCAFRSFEWITGSGSCKTIFHTAIFAIFSVYNEKTYNENSQQVCMR